MNMNMQLECIFNDSTLSEQVHGYKTENSFEMRQNQKEKTLAECLKDLILNIEKKLKEKDF